METAGKSGMAVGICPAAPGRVALPDVAIEVRLAQLDLAAAQVERCADLLSRDEAARAARFHFDRDRRRFTVARGILRCLLGEHLGVAPAAIAFEYGKNGKPLIGMPVAPIHFNVSHSGERALYAISRDCVLGVDIECLDRDVNTDALARRFLTSNEYAALQRVPQFDRKRAFFACWTRKEAVIKATGDGLSQPLDQFEVMIAPEDALRPFGQSATLQRIADWSIYPVDVGSRHVATVAAYRDKSHA